MPDYMGLSVVSVACGAVAWAYYALGVVLSIYILNARYPIQVRHEQFVDAALGLFGSIGVGIVFHAISYATDALRDIARNSFR